MKWDLSKFSVNLFSLSHVLIFLSSSFNIEITVDSFSVSIYTLVSSENKIGKRTSETLDKSLIFNMKGSGPRILPCGTPQVTASVLDLNL